MLLLSVLFTVERSVMTIACMMVNNLNMVNHPSIDSNNDRCQMTFISIDLVVVVAADDYFRIVAVVVVVCTSHGNCIAFVL